MNKLLVAAQLVVLSTVLEATVFRDQVATAAALGEAQGPCRLTGYLVEA